ncbi:MAG TPA: methyltransferase domain-containing protein [Pirellulales bacterium]|jgi:hypothetical protein|nr:methyltransferase domain-containing protein [Pirellulales bacterium]
MKLDGNLRLDRYAWAAEIIRELLPASPAPVVADVGAHGDRMQSAVAVAGGRWHGFDLVPASAEVVRWDLNSPAPVDATRPGVVLLMDVIEHLGNPWLAMKHLASFMLPGAYLVLTTPNPRWSRSRFYELAKGTPNCFTQSDLDLNHHVFPVWPHIAERLLGDHGLTVERYVTLDGPTRLPDRPFGLRYPLRLAFSVACRAIERRDPTACGMSFGVIARRRELPTQE